MLQFPSNIAQNKKEIRNFCKKIRDELYLSNQCDRISNLITDRILKLDDFLKAKNVMLFYPLEKEINLLRLLECKNKNFYFPRCDGNNLLVCPFGREFFVNKYGISEPKSEPIGDLSIIDIIFTPALCIDLSLYRIGYGGGFYDRFFADRKITAKKIVPISERFITQKLPIDDFDISCDYGICESGVIKP